jgi:hypothetical protein
MRMLAAAVLLAALAAGATAPTAGAADARIKAEYDYRVSVKGTQTTTWTSEDAFVAHCLDGERGEGSQTVTFRSKAMPMHAYDGMPQPFFFKPGDRGDLELSLSGTVERRAGVTCAAPGWEPEAGDCASKPFHNLKVNPRYLYGRNRIVLDQAYGDGVADFEACPILGDEWPLLLEQDSHGTPVGKDLKATRLFGRRRTVLVATATAKRTGAAYTSTTTIRWELTFTRLKKTRIRH